MAVPRWTNVAVPNSSGALQALSNSGQQIGSSINSLGQLFTDAANRNTEAEALQTQANTDSAIANIMASTSTSDLAGKTALDGALSRSSLDKQYGTSYDPLQVAKAITQREDSLYGRETDATKYQDKLDQQDIVNTRADKTLTLTEQRDAANKTNKEANLQFKQDQLASTEIHQNDTREEIARKNTVAEQLAQDKFDLEKTKVEGEVKAGQPPTDTEGNPVYGLIDNPNLSLTGEQGKAAGFAASMADSMQVIDGLIDSGFNPVSSVNRASSYAAENLNAGGIAKANQSSEGQRLDTAYKNIVSAILRSETGAGFGAPEKTDVEQRIVPSAGDSKELLLQKRKYLDVYLNAMSKKSGGGYALDPSIAERGDVWSTKEYPLLPSSEPSRPQAEAAPATSSNAMDLRIGDTQGGYTFSGGNPNDRNNWTPVGGN